jgi:threonine synthase
MGLPIGKIVCGVNENREFPHFLETGDYVVRPSIKSPSSAMIVSNPSNFARLVDLYGGHVYDKRDARGKIIQEGVIDMQPDLSAMCDDLCSMSVSNPDHYQAMREVYDRFRIIIEPHGAVGWRALDTFLGGIHDRPAVVYETADPGKFPDDIQKAIGVVPAIPENIRRQSALQERIYSIDEAPDFNKDGSMALSDAQYEQAKEIVRTVFSSAAYNRCC